MPRKARTDAPGALHHVIIRGIERLFSNQKRTAQKNIVSLLKEELPLADVPSLRAAEVMSLEIDQVTAFGKSPQTVKARSLLCFWLHRKLGMTTVEIGKRLTISQSAASRSSLRGEKIAIKNKFDLVK